MRFRHKRERLGRVKRPWRVQLVVDGDQEYFRETMLGARRRAFERGRLEFVDRWLPQELAGGDLRSLVARDGVRGIVAAIHDPVREAVFRALPVPVVNVSNGLAVPRLPVVTQDDREVGRIAAEHLLGRGLRGFLFWGQRGGASYSEGRRRGFLEAMEAAGVPRASVVFGGTMAQEMGADAVREEMREALRRLERPAGVFAVLDHLALAILRTARDVGLRVPEDLAVLGAGDDDFWVEFERTPLSSVRLPAREIGYEAAALLENLIARGRRGTRRGAAEFVALPGARVVARQSSETLGGGDALVARAAALLREHPGARVAEIARACGVARSGLQRRFIQALGHGILEERRRVRLARVERLLLASDAKLSVVAVEAGYPSAQRLAADLRRAHGCTPGVWRRRAR
ncbi:MAG: substrate-binding domain-containing protein [Opitutaceae bacterium]|nr:substrate-binding domain-containing protein [Opitutaceae bacterium]